MPSAIRVSRTGPNREDGLPKAGAILPARQRPGPIPAMVCRIAFCRSRQALAAGAKGIPGRPAGDGIDAAELGARDRLRQLRGAAAANASSARSGAPLGACPPPAASPARGPPFRRSRSRLVSGPEPGDDAAMTSGIAAGPPSPGSSASRPGPFARLVKGLQNAASAPKSRTSEWAEASLIV